MKWIEGISPITFPGLGIEIDPASGFSIGSFSVNFYGVIIAIGLILAVVYAWKRCDQFGIKADDITDGVLYIVPFAVLCARAYYCVFQWETYAANPISVLYIWEGGLAIYGGVLGAILGVVVYCYFKKIKVPALLDLVALGFLIGQSMGRWGNFFNREAFGAETESFLRMGLYLSADRFPSSIIHYYHPTFLYESLWNLVGFVILHFLSKRRQYDGQVALGYVVWYGLGRAIIEGLRTDSLYWGDFRVSQVLAVISCVAGAAVLCVMAFRKHSTDKLFVNQVAAKAAAAAEEKDASPEEE
jgi:phosphatidylglycerol:prolipoprotein diacylglycerol transferase